MRLPTSLSLARSIAVLVICSAWLAPIARAQTHAQTLESLASTDELRSLRALAGPRARVVVEEDGALRTLFGAAIRPVGASTDASALAFLDRFGTSFGLPRGATFAVHDVVPAHGFSVVHLARTIEGREVALASVVVRARPDGLLDFVHVDAMPDATAAWPRAIDLQAVESAALGAPNATAIVSHREVWLALGDTLRPAIELEVSGTHRTDAVRTYVDALTAELLVVEPLVTDATGRVYPSNPVTDETPMDLELSELTSREALTGRFARVVSCDQSAPDCPTIRHALADADGNFLFEPMPHAFDDAFAEVSAYYHLGRAASYMASAHGFTWSCGGNTAMDVLVNYTESPGVAYDNAAFSPGFRGGCGFLLFGQGAEDFAYDGDVVYHEHGHAVTDAITDLGFFGSGPSPHFDPLAINEGTSDYWASAIQGNPSIAESITNLEGSGGSLRVIDEAITCPADLFGEGHFDGRLWSGLGWDTRVAIGQERTDEMFYVAVATTSGSATLTDAATSFLATAMSAESMGTITAEELSMVEAAIAGRGLDDCGHVVPLDDGAMHQGYSGDGFVTGGVGHGLAPLQYSIEIPPDVLRVEIDLAHLTFTGHSIVHVSSGLPVRANASRVSSAARVEVGRSGTASFDLSTGVVPCQRLYIGVETTDLRTGGPSLYTIAARLETLNQPGRACPAPMPDAGPRDASTTADAGPDDAGPTVVSTPASCGCRAQTGSSSTLAALAMIGLALVVARRRQR